MIPINKRNILLKEFLNCDYLWKLTLKVCLKICKYKKKCFILIVFITNKRKKEIDQLSHLFNFYLLFNIQKGYVRLFGLMAYQCLLVI